MSSKKRVSVKSKSVPSYVDRYVKNMRNKGSSNTLIVRAAANKGFVRNTRRTMAHEIKVLDILRTVFAVENTGTQLQLLNGCTQGTNTYNRIGRKIVLKSTQIRGIVAQTDDTTVNTEFRMIIVWDKQGNGAAPSYANVMQSQNIAGALEATVDAAPNINNRERFEIIRDKKMCIAGRSNTATQSYAGSPSVLLLDEFIDLKDRHTVYNDGSAGTVGDIVTGALYVFFISDQTNANGVTATVSFRTRFVDP